jgi:hypothetical protein
VGLPVRINILFGMLYFVTSACACACARARDVVPCIEVWHAEELRFVTLLF